MIVGAPLTYTTISNVYIFSPQNEGLMKYVYISKIFMPSWSRRRRWVGLVGMAAFTAVLWDRPALTWGGMRGLLRHRKWWLPGYHGDRLPWGVARASGAAHGSMWRWWRCAWASSVTYRAMTWHIHSVPGTACAAGRLWGTRHVD